MLSPEHETSLSELLKREIPNCIELVSCERLSGGASQETYCLTIKTDTGHRKLAMRRAPGGIDSSEDTGQPGIAGEVKLMRAARAAGVPEPDIHLVLKPDDGMGEAFIMQWLEGETFGSRITRADEFSSLRTKLAYQCGQILARIHAIDIKRTGLDEILGTVTPGQSVDLMWDRYLSFNTPQPMIDYSARWLKANLPSDPRSCLVHNDFRNGNLMVGAEGIRAVLDWELACIGDPMRDLGWICTNSWRFGRSDMPVGGFGNQADLFRGYEDECGIRPDAEHVKFWEVFGSFWWAVGCLEMAEHYRNGPDKSVERPGIARRTSECQIDCVNLLIPGPLSLIEAKVEKNSDMPRLDELVQSVRDFLREEVMQETQGRTSFLARVAANSLDIVQRDLQTGEAARQVEHSRLRKILNADAKLETLRWQLVTAIRNDEIPLEDPELITHLRETVANQLAIDQPRYSGLATALSLDNSSPPM